MRESTEARDSVDSLNVFSYFTCPAAPAGLFLFHPLRPKRIVHSAKDTKRVRGGAVCTLVLFGFLTASATTPTDTSHADPSPLRPSARTRERTETVQHEIRSVTFEGNDQITAKELLGQIATRETPGWFDKFLYRSISERLGRKNEYFDLLTYSSDVERIRKYYVNRGFDEVTVDTAVVYSAAPPTVDVKFLIAEGYRSKIDTLQYRGIVDETGTIWKDIAAAPKISQGDHFSRILLEEEVKRILYVLNDNGYPNSRYLRDSSGATRYTSTRNYSVILSFQMNRRYRFGAITVVQEVDSLRGGEYRTDITDDLLLSNLDFTFGDFYGVQKRVDSERNLNKLGVFDLRSMTMKVPAPTDTSILVPTAIRYMPRDKHEIAPELIVSDENGAFNIGAGLGYTQRNFFGGGRLFNARLRFTTQTILAFPHYFDLYSEAISNLDLTFELQQPYVFSNKIRGTWSFSNIVDKQLPYKQFIVRNNIGLYARTGEFTVTMLGWTLEAVDLQKNSQYAASLSDPVVQQQIQRLLPRQVNSILSFTTQRDKSNDLFSPSAGFIHTLTLEEAGLLPKLLGGLFGDIPYTQFYRMILMGRWYEDITDHRFTVFAYKAKLGFEGKYGESRSDTSRQIPQTNRFYAGGGNSVRGWNPRELIASGDPRLGGNLAFEASVEWRINILQSLKDGLWDKLWLIQFIDAGNVWVEPQDFRLRQVALAIGLGIRYDTFFGPFRLDWGVRIFDPAAPPGNEWITQKKFWSETVRQSVFHFGIGHAF
jgi:outer membrane protein insertion porin family